MRFVDVPAGQPIANPTAHSDITPVGFHSPVSLDPADAPTHTPAPPRTQTPAAVTRRAPAARPQRPMRRAIKRAWGNFTWSVSTWFYRRTRSALLEARSLQAEVVQAAQPDETVYVAFANG